MQRPPSSKGGAAGVDVEQRTADGAVTMRVEEVLIDSVILGVHART